MTLLALAVAAATAATASSLPDCRPGVTLMSAEKPEPARAQPREKAEPRKRPARRCMILASA